MPEWNQSTVTLHQWWPLSQVSSIYSNDGVGVDFRYKVSDTDSIRLSDETWRNVRAFTSQLSRLP